MAVLAASISLGALPASAQAPVPPQGSLTLVALLSDGMTLHPVASGVLPVTCVVAP